MGKSHGNVSKKKSLLIDLNAEMPTRANQIELERAWAAGLVDGEMCISITSCTNSRKRSLPVYSAVMTLSMVRPEAIKRFHGIVGGTLGRTRDEYGTVYQWRAYGNKASVIAKMLLPYLVLKGRQAELLIEFQLTKGKSWQKVSPETRAHREALLTEMSCLNRCRVSLDAERLSEATPRKEDDTIVRSAANEEAAEAGRNVQPAVVH